MKNFSLLFISATLVLAACGGGDEKNANQASDSTATQDKVKMVELLTLTPKLFNTYIDVQGKVDADENVSITAEMPGTVSKVHAKLGDLVVAGQVLAELESKALQQGISELQTGLDLAKTVFEKQKNLWDQKIGTEIQYLQAKTQKESLEKRMASMQEQIKMNKIISPINGIVDAVDIKVGQATAPGMPAIRVVNMNTLKVKAEVAESYVSKVKAGNDAIIIYPDSKDTSVAKVTYAAKVISPLNRTFTATINIDHSKDVHPNQVAMVKIINYVNPKALVAPVGTIQHNEDGDFIFIADGKKAKKVQVKTGNRYNGYTEVLEGLKEGDKLITRGYQDLNDGEAITFK